MPLYRSKVLLSFAVILFVLFQTGECLWCYNCSSHYGGDCDFPINTTTIRAKHCSYTQNRCIIVNQTINGVPQVRRNCGHEDYCPGNTRVFSKGCSDCSWDLCNSSSVKRVSFTVAIMSMIFVNIFWFCILI